MVGKRILIVEDDAVQRRQMRRVLEALSYATLLAANGDEAVRVLEQEEIDLVLTDMRMPGMSGNQFLRHVRERYPHIPVAAVTAYPEEIEEPEPRGILTKPFGITQLEELVRRLLGYHPL